MHTAESNISIKIRRNANKILLILKIEGEFTDDNFTLLKEQLDATLNALGNIDDLWINALVDITQLESWTLQQGRDDLQLGLSQLTAIKKIAIIGNQSWQQLLSKVADWFVTADVHYFENKTSAIHWLTN